MQSVCIQPPRGVVCLGVMVEHVCGHIEGSAKGFDGEAREGCMLGRIGRGWRG